tara:strand:- start:1557 stop:2291 length:735 start_codon:yes stop_codon:yes gene_type:complete
MSDVVKDTLFLNNKSSVFPFNFNEDVAEVFDDMLSRSVPCYWDIVKLIVVCIAEITADKVHIYDLGCSTGNVIKSILIHLNLKNVRIEGVDLSAAMLSQTATKLNCQEKQLVNLIQHDLNESISLQQTNAIILNLTLQFLKKSARYHLLKNCYSKLERNGIVVVVEKVLGRNSDEEALHMTRFEYFKRLNGYSLEEIDNKKKSLVSILRPLTIEENEKMFHDVGFKRVSQSFRWLNFVAWELRK